MTKIVADSACDITKIEDMETNGISFESIPLLIYTDNDQFLDDGSINIGEMLDKLEKHNGRSYTSCPGVDSWIKAFGEEEEIYVVTITSGLSGTYNSACNAKEMYLEKHPNAKVEVFDSLSTGPEMKMAIEKIVELKNNNASFEEVCEKVHKYIDDVRLFFVLASIRNLAQNGRVSKLVASTIGVLGISIIGIASEEGKINPISKARGEKRIVSQLMTEFDKVDYHGGNISICNVQNESLSELLKAEINKKYPEAKVKIYPAGGLCSYYAERKGIIIGIET